MRLLFATVLLASHAYAEAPAAFDPAGDREAIKAQAGCFNVSFEFVETFARQAGYQPKPPYRSGGTEWVEVIEDESDRIALQHILVMPDGGLKHWRQVWDYEPQHVFEFRGDETWQKRRIDAGEARGAWAQRVFQVDDGPRYECVAPWVRFGAKRYWECEAWSPLPRREEPRAAEYDVLVRRNRHELLAGRWRHEQDNLKLALREGREQPLVEEKGLNRYVEVDAGRCATAAQWWAVRAAAWRAIQAAWDDVYAAHDRLHMPPHAGQEPLWVELSELADDAAQSGDGDLGALRATARARIEARLEP
jgi:hypothetical protein